MTNRLTDNRVTIHQRLFSFIAMLLVAIGSTAQTFYNLTPDDVRIDSVLPSFA